jgi:Tol biopolymer transport system component
MGGRWAWVPALLLLTTLPALPAGVTKVERVSISTAGAQGDGSSQYPVVSADGRFVAFGSAADNLVAGDTNKHYDVFVRDRQTGSTERVSISTAGAQGDGDSASPAISADGRFVAFQSAATNLVPGDTNGHFDVFVRDRLTGNTERVSVSSSGAQADGNSGFAAISGDGRFVAFSSAATNLVPGDTNNHWDVFVRDRLTGNTERINLSTAGAQGDGDSLYPAPAISADGRFVAFSSAATNLVPGDTNGLRDVFVRDRQTGSTERVSVSSAGAQGDAISYAQAISGDGRFVAFASTATNLVPGDTNGHYDVFVRDRQTGSTERVSLSSAGAQGDEDSLFPSISADGRFVAYLSAATNLVADDTNGGGTALSHDVFLRDRQTGSTERISVSAPGAQSNGNSIYPIISGDGHFVAYFSSADNLVPGDTNKFDDVFVVELNW